jgi:hypothetical protein
MLSVTSVAPRRRACAAIKQSYGPIGVPLLSQIRANVAGVRGIFGIERQHHDAEAEKSLQQLLSQLAPAALFIP